MSTARALGVTRARNGWWLHIACGTCHRTHRVQITTPTAVPATFTCPDIRYAHRPKHPLEKP